MADIRSETLQDPADLQPACETGRLMHRGKTKKITHSNVDHVW